MDNLELALGEVRRDLEQCIARLENFIAERGKSGAELTLAKRKLQEARHWLGECQRIEGFAKKYPN